MLTPPKREPPRNHLLPIANSFHLDFETLKSGQYFTKVGASSGRGELTLKDLRGELFQLPPELLPSSVQGCFRHRSV